MSTREQWRITWRELGIHGCDDALFDDLIARYSESHRKYHTLQHLQECFAQWLPVRSDAARPAEIELALWFHDAFYDGKCQDNEQRSADWARDVALR